MQKLACIHEAPAFSQSPSHLNMTAETHSKRQATQHGCLPSVLGDGDKGIEIVYGEGKNILYGAD